MKPEGVGQASWEAALSAFEQAIGSERVFTSDEDIALYRDAYSPMWGEADERLISAAVAPTSTEEVQAIVRTANQFGIPIYPISTGKNLGYGGSAPNLSGSVVVDLKDMRSIIEVDDERHFAIVEPGVSYFDLFDYIQERDLKCWIDCPDPGWGSLVGNALEHGVGHTWYTYRDHFASHCGMEVVLPNGDIVRTGMGALPGSKTWSDFRYGFGPDMDGIFGQGNFGIVTKMGFHLMPQPDAFISKKVRVPRRRDIIPLVKITNEFEYGGILGMPIYESPLTQLQAAGDEELGALMDSPEVWHNDSLDLLAASRELPFWECTLQFYGPREGIYANFDFVKDRILAEIPDAEFVDLEELQFPLSQEEQASVRHKVAVGIPNLNIFSVSARSRTNPNPGDGHLLFSPVIPRTGTDLLEAQQIFGEALRGSPLASLYTPFTPPFTWLHRCFALACGFPISRSDPSINAASRDAMETVIRIGAENGYGEYRTPPLFQDLVSSTYSYNNHALRRLTETVKDAVDPNGIIAAGRNGIWPKHLRERRQ